MDAVACGMSSTTIVQIALTCVTSARLFTDGMDAAFRHSAFDATTLSDRTH
jgi:hypothetical protein